MDKNKKKQFMLFTPETMHVREHVREDGTKEPSRTIYGRAIVFNKVFEYEDFWGDKYRETIKPSACTKEFLESQDIKLNLLHKREMSIARSNCGEGNLRYSVSDEGVDFVDGISAATTPTGTPISIRPFSLSSRRTPTVFMSLM